jgi:thiol-disulfide isomerase/thioredoxin
MIRKFAVLVASVGLALALTTGSWAETCGAEKAASCSAEKAAACSAEKAAGCSGEKMAACAGDKAEGCPVAKAAAEKLGGGDTVATDKAATAAKKFYDLGDKISDFTAVDVRTDQEVTLSKLAGEKGTVIIFWNQSCPWVVGPRGAEERIKAFAAKYKEQGVNTIAIDAGIDNTIEAVKEHAAGHNLTLLVNRDSSIAAKFNASYTPQTYVLDKDMKLVYRGAFDVRRGETYADYAAQAVEDVIAGREPAVKEAKGTGCTIKWAPGSKPQV